MVENWFADFERDRKNTDGAECSGHPNSVVVPQNMKKVNKMVFADLKLKLRVIADTMAISGGSVFAILHEHSSMRKLCM